MNRRNLLPFLILFYLLLGFNTHPVKAQSPNEQEKYRVELLADVIDYIFLDHHFQGKVSRESRAALLHSIPLNQSATRELAEKGLDFSLGKGTKDDFQALIDLLLGSLKANPSRMNDPERFNALLDLENNLNYKLETIPQASKSNKPEQVISSSQGIKEQVEKLIDQVEELKIAQALIKPKEPVTIYLGLGLLGLCFLVTFILFLGQKRQNRLLKNLVGKLQYQMEALHHRIFDIEAQMMQVPFELKEWSKMQEAMQEKNEDVGIEGKHLENQELAEPKNSLFEI